MTDCSVVEKNAELKAECMLVASAEKRDEPFVLEVLRLLGEVEITDPVHLQGDLSDYTFKTKLDGSKKISSRSFWKNIKVSP